MKSFKDYILGFQHLAACFGATILVPLLTGLNISVALFTAGLGTLLFHFITGKKVPIFLGSSFAFIPGIIAVAATTKDLAYAQGGIVLAGIAYLLFALLTYHIGPERIQKIFKPNIIGAMITIIGLNLVPVALDMSSLNWALALLTLGVAGLVKLLVKGFANQLLILIAIAFGYLGGVAANLIDFGVITSAPWFAVPEFTLPKFSFEAAVIIVPVVLATFMEHIGDITANQTITGKNYIKDPGLHRTLMGDGVATAVAGLLGGPANTTYGENTGVLALTKNYNPKVLRIAAFFAIGLSFFSKAGAVLSSIPTAALGGISLLLFGMIAKIGISTLTKEDTFKSIPEVLITLIMLIIGLGSPIILELFGIDLTIYITDTVQLSKISLAAVFGVVATLIYEGLKRGQKTR